jgi:hypothetical protein
MSLFPVAGRLGDNIYELTRLGSSGVLTLKETNEVTGSSTSICFPDAMIRTLARRAIAVRLKFHAAEIVARMFHTSEPVWPTDIFDDEDPSR